MNDIQVSILNYEIHKTRLYRRFEKKKRKIQFTLIKERNLKHQMLLYIQIRKSLNHNDSQWMEEINKRENFNF